MGVQWKKNGRHNLPITKWTAEAIMPCSSSILFDGPLMNLCKNISNVIAVFWVNNPISLDFRKRRQEMRFAGFFIHYVYHRNIQDQQGIADQGPVTTPG